MLGYDKITETSPKKS